MSDANIKPQVIQTDDVEATKVYISYNNVHQLCQEVSQKIKEFKPDLIIAIGMSNYALSF